MVKLFKKHSSRKSYFPNNSTTTNPQIEQHSASGRKTIQKSSLMKQMQIHPSPSLIRRARIIRRRTTNLYCDTLKKLREEDTVLISQILIIKLKPRWGINQSFCSNSFNFQIRSHSIRMFLHCQ
jgi:hypothetical protein